MIRNLRWPPNFNIGTYFEIIIPGNQCTTWES